MESELFGYVEGAFTGATKKGKMGMFEFANNGTLFLDEIGDMPIGMQSKLLRVLQDGLIYKLGSEKPIHTDARIIAATNKDLKKSIEEGTFRNDLFYRLAIVQVELPPLRERREDIKDLINLFINQLSEKEKIEIMDYMERKLDLLSKMENSNDSINIDEISDIFADLTGYIISEYYKEDDNTNLYWLGYNLGRFIYLIDAYDDLKEDMEHNKFNAIEKAFNKNKLPFEEFIDTIRERIELNLILSAESCVTSLKNLPLKKNKELLTNILQLGLMEKIESIKIKECKKHEKSI